MVRRNQGQAEEGPTFFATLFPLAWGLITVTLPYASSSSMKKGSTYLQASWILCKLLVQDARHRETDSENNQKEDQHTLPPHFHWFKGCVIFSSVYICLRVQHSIFLWQIFNLLVLDPAQTFGAGFMPWRNQEWEQPEGPVYTYTYTYIYMCVYIHIWYHLVFISLRIFQFF